MTGFGEKYNGNRKDALTKVHIVREIDEAITILDEQYGTLPKLIASSARDGGKRISFKEITEQSLVVTLNVKGFVISVPFSSVIFASIHSILYFMM